METSDAEWLCGAEARRALADLASSGEPAVTQASRLRKAFTAEQTHLLLEQLELRQRARRKFDQADHMFFTRVGLEQATDQWVAHYKASRFAGTIADLCCGVGGDLIALAQNGQTIGVDLNPALTVLAEANTVANSATTRTIATEASPAILADTDAWHADPDRRPHGRRTTHVDAHSPDTVALDAFHEACPHAAIKLAPAAVTPDHWQATRELEWISRQGECRQLVVWSGGLAKARGHRKATALHANGGVASFTGDPTSRTEVLRSAGRFIYEPDAAVLAAGLDGALAATHQLQRITPSAAYLTGAELVDDPLLALFEVVDQLPLRPKTVAAYLKERKVGVVEIKHRGVSLDPDAFRKQLKLCGDRTATLLATAIDKKPVVYVVERQTSQAP